MARAVAAWSPVIIFTRMPAAWHSATASIASARGGSIRPIRPISVSRPSRSAVFRTVWSCGTAAHGDGDHPLALRGELLDHRVPVAASSGSVPPSAARWSAQRASTASGAPLTWMQAWPSWSWCSTAM